MALKGGRAEHPESTMFAYERNLQVGLSLDMDIRKTAEGETGSFNVTGWIAEASVCK